MFHLLILKAWYILVSESVNGSGKKIMVDLFTFNRIGVDMALPVEYTLSAFFFPIYGSKFESYYYSSTCRRYYLGKLFGEKPVLCITA